MDLWKHSRRNIFLRKLKKNPFVIMYAIVCITLYTVLQSEIAKIEKIKELTRKERRLLQNNGRKNVSLRSTTPYNIDLNKPVKFNLFEKPFSFFKYPLNVNITKLVDNYKQNRELQVKPVNYFPYQFILKSENICSELNNQTQTEVLVLFLVKSAVQHLERRKTIRTTWAQKVVNAKFKCVFIVGTHKESNTLQESVIAENYIYRDIVQIDFKDNYYNNTLKTMGGFKWAVEFCKEIKFVLLVDDDFFVSTDSLISYLEDLKAYKTDRLYMGNVFDFPRPYRSHKSRWSVSVQEYPYDKYPSFVSAGAVLMSMAFVEDFVIAMQYTKIFKYDDIFMAIVAYKLRVIPTGNKRFHMKKVPYQSPYFDDILTSHGYSDSKEMHMAWSCVTYKICS